MTKERKRCVTILDEWEARYPKSVFPDESNSDDAKAARFARHRITEIRKDVLGEARLLTPC